MSPHSMPTNGSSQPSELLSEHSGEVSYLKDCVNEREIEHEYGPRVHICADPYLLTQLARVCAPETTQPAVNHLMESCYRSLFIHAINREFPRSDVRCASRMAQSDDRGYYHGSIVNPATRAVTVNIARAGTFPSHICFQMMNEFLDPAGIRQDHISMNREVDAAGKVVGAAMHGTKIGGDIENRILLLPDPMAATGSSLIKAINHYKSEIPGIPLKIINMHLIVTPNYLRAMLDAHPDVIIFAVRVDRGASGASILQSKLGEHWDKEDGLNAQQYILPGGGGLGEVLNNSYV